MEVKGEVKGEGDRMRVLVCGGRDYSLKACGKQPGREMIEEQQLYRTMNELHKRSPIDLLIHGGSYGADTCAGRWAHRVCIPCLSVPANWDRYGRKAGPIRNARMLEEWNPDVVIAFPGGDGTADMVQKAVAAGVKVMEVEELT